MSNWKINNADVLEALRDMPDNSFDGVLCDPPYGLSEQRQQDVVDCMTAWLSGQPYQHKKSGFMGRGWDGWVPGPDVWREVLRVMKPGAHILAFAGTRTQDLMGIALRLAGFELRDTVIWAYGSGFPKSMNVGDGYGTALKPAYEPCILARKPLDGTVAKNCQTWGCGALWIDEGRDETKKPAQISEAKKNPATGKRDAEKRQTQQLSLLKAANQ